MGCVEKAIFATVWWQELDVDLTRQETGKMVFVWLETQVHTVLDTS